MLKFLAVRVLPSGKAPASQAGIRGFDPRHPLHIKTCKGFSGREPFNFG